MSSRLFACISSMRPTRSRLSFAELSTVVPRFNLARIDAAEGQRADERIVHDLERQHREGLVVGGCGPVSSAVSNVEPLIAGMSIGDGR